MLALITGGNKGLGKEIVLYFAKKNIDVIFTYNKDKDDAINTINEVKENYNILVKAIKCDISKEDEVEILVNKVLDYCGEIDILVNNAGICNDSLLFDKTYKDFKKVIDVNLIGTFLVSKYVGKIMLNQKHGNIINISSTNAIDSFYPESIEYDATKSGIISMTHNFAKELAPFIRVNCVCPGWIKTGMNENLSIEQIQIEKEKILLKRFADPIEIAKVVYFLTTTGASYINDSILKVDGGRVN